MITRQSALKVSHYSCILQVGVFSEEVLRERIVKIVLNKTKVSSLSMRVGVERKRGAGVCHTDRLPLNIPLADAHASPVNQCCLKHYRRFNARRALLCEECILRFAMLTDAGHV